MRDEKGFDFKVLCVAIGDAHQQHIERLEQVRPHRLVEIEHFFETYKALEDKTVDVVGWRDHDRALEVLRDRPRGLGARDRPSRPRDRERGRRPRYPGEDLPGRRLFVAVPLPPDADAADRRSSSTRVRAAGRPGRRP